jgi:hypothetical protein
MSEREVREEDENANGPDSLPIWMSIPKGVSVGGTVLFDFFSSLSCLVPDRWSFLRNIYHIRHGAKWWNAT